MKKSDRDEFGWTPLMKVALKSREYSPCAINGVLNYFAEIARTSSEDDVFHALPLFPRPSISAAALFVLASVDSLSEEKRRRCIEIANQDYAMAIDAAMFNRKDSGTQPIDPEKLFENILLLETGKKGISKYATHVFLDTCIELMEKEPNKAPIVARILKFPLIEKSIKTHLKKEITIQEKLGRLSELTAAVMETREENDIPVL